MGLRMSRRYRTRRPHPLGDVTLWRQPPKHTSPHVLRILALHLSTPQFIELGKVRLRVHAELVLLRHLGVVLPQLDLHHFRMA